MPVPLACATGGAASTCDVAVARPSCWGYPSLVTSPFDARRGLLGAAKKFILETPEAPDPAHFDAPRLTLAALEKIRMSRSRDRILANLEEMYSEAFKRAKESEDEAQMASLDFAYRREQLYFEILLDVRDAVERRG